MRRFPPELEALLTPKGRRVLARRSSLSGVLARGKTRFFAAHGLLDEKKSRAVAALLDAALGPVMAPMVKRVPPESTSGMTRDYSELLPKTVSVLTADLDSRRNVGWARANEVGLIDLLRSDSFHAFAEALSGYPLRRARGLQALCYRPGDFAGPHNDHHPEEPLASGGYTDVHLTFCTGGVAHQWLVYERRGLFSEIVDVASRGGVTCYRLPFWHHVTPLVAKRSRAKDARRWVLLGTFLDDPARR